MNNLTKNDYINSNNFLNFSDVFYGAYIQNEDLHNYNKDDYRVLLDENGSKLIKMKSFKLKENDVIFCHSFLLEPLFNHLKDIRKFKNIKLITHQSDMAIGKSEFMKKPQCISKWYAINVNYRNENLIPIPIGIGNDSNQKTLTSKHFETLSLFGEKSNKLYLNFNMNTNYFHRYKAFKSLNNKKFVFHDKPQLNLNKFVKNLNNYKFSLAPWGNGYDTHRLWEALYAGSIPVTLFHPSLETFSDFPIIFLDTYKSFDVNSVNVKDSNYFYNEKLNINWWFKLINDEKIKSSNQEIEFVENKKVHDFNVRLFFKQYHKFNKVKDRNTLNRKLHKKTFGYKIDNIFGL
tara:strand:+ start:8973 stop:10013 length:1041 start_codon:yes stop_codon:yes gene_type:complete